MAEERGENNKMRCAGIQREKPASPVKKGKLQNGEEGGKAEERVFYPEECMVDLLRQTPGINLFEPNKREQLNSP